jgi:hypothetical protein
MTEMTPEMEELRQVAGYLVDIEEGAYARRVDKALRAWEADLARIEALEGLMRFAPTVGHIVRAGHHRLAKVIDEETTDEEKTALVGFEEELAALAAEKS